jgi:uncharacterized protein (DUF58 family)
MPLRPTVRGVGLALGGIVAILAGVAVGSVDLVRIGTLPLLLVIGALVGVGLIDPARGRHRLAVLRTATPNPVHAGSTSRVGVEVSAADPSGRARLTGLRLGEQASAELSDGHPLRAHVTREPGRITLTYPVVAARRGRWPLGPLVITRVDPFGVAKATTSLGDRAQIAVWPAVIDLQISREALVGDPDRVSLGARTPSTDDASLRDYHSGDDLRRVHWATSARRGELMVRSDERAGLRPVTVLLDLPTRQASLEWSISLATSMALAMLDAGHPVRFLCDPSATDVEHLGRDTGTRSERPGPPRQVHVRPGGVSHADILDSTIDLDVAESPSAAEEDLVAAARILAASEHVSETVLAVLGPLGVQARTALVHVADSAQAWAVVRSGDGSVGQTADASSTVASLRHAGWRAITAEPGEDIAHCWRRLLGSGR